MPHRIYKCTDTLYDYAIIIINTYVSLMYELKEWKGIYEYICWDWAGVLLKKNLPGCGVTNV
jgi:hypothetical protein